MNTHLFLYARKSTDVEDKQVLSIDAQLHELREFAAREHITVVEEFIEKRSAKIPGRPIFNDMLARLERGDAAGILAWHPDRLARNSMDGGRIIYLLDTGKIATLKFPRSWFENTPQGKLMLHNDFGFSKYYVDSLSENTKRGLREKVRRGEFPQHAPFGYLNDYRVKKIIIDKERAPVVVEAFERYATGKETLDSLRDDFTRRGILSSLGKQRGRSFFSRMLSNPIYYGHFRFSNEIHAGTHEPIISKALFDAVQVVLHRRFRYSPTGKTTIPKVFAGLLHCPDCGCSITAEVQKGHIYYRCTKKNRAVTCSQPYMREEALDRELSELLRPFVLPADIADKMLTRLATDKRAHAESSAGVLLEKRAEIDKITSRLQKLLDSFLDGVFDRDTYVTTKASLLGQKKRLEEACTALGAGQSHWLEPFQKWILTAKDAGNVAITGSPQDKRVLAQSIFGSNLFLDRKKARGSCIKPWSLLVEKGCCTDMVPGAGLEPA